MGFGVFTMIQMPGSIGLGPVPLHEPQSKYHKVKILQSHCGLCFWLF